MVSAEDSLLGLGPFSDCAEQGRQMSLLKKYVGTQTNNVLRSKDVL